MHIPTHPEDHEKHAYTEHWQHWLTILSFIGFTGVLVSSLRFFHMSPVLAVFYPFLLLTCVYYLISLFTQGLGKKFDRKAHVAFITKWKPATYPRVDVFLPTCGEDITIIRNTWEGVRNITKHYQGQTTVYCLDDGASGAVESLAREFGFTYSVRDNRGHFKKAGNLRHGFENSSSEFIAIFDADFKPRADFLNELLPYFYADKKLGIVQSPQYFDVHPHQNWLERGAGAVQEYFYRSVQQNRQRYDGAICVGSNALYRREALATNGGATLIEHSEDVHTGFDLKVRGWELLYLPVVLAKGVCPHDLGSFFRQQYRWCLGSMSLLKSKKFWHAKLPFTTRLCYISGFLYYIHTGIFTIIAPLIPLALLCIVPTQAKLINYLLLIPATLYLFVFFPLWHKAKYGFETLSVKIVYGWAHLFAVIDAIRSGGMEWHPTGVGVQKKSGHYQLFTILIIAWSLLVSVVWVAMALWYMIHWSVWDFLPICISGGIYLLTVARVAITAYGLDK